MSGEIEPGSLGRLAILIGEVRSLRAAGDRLAAEIVEIHRMQIQTLGFMQEVLALFSAPAAPPAEEAYSPRPEAAGESVDAIPDEPWVDDAPAEKRAPAPAQKAEKKRRSS